MSHWVNMNMIIVQFCILLIEVCWVSYDEVQRHNGNTTEYDRVRHPPSHVPWNVTFVSFLPLFRITVRLQGECFSIPTN